MPYRQCPECDNIWYSSDTTERIWDCPHCNYEMSADCELNHPPGEAEREEEADSHH